MIETRRYGEQFETLQDSDYYTVPKDRLNSIHYSKLSQPARHDIYIMKRFDESPFSGAFQSTLTNNQRIYAAQGCLVLRKFIPDDLIDAYIELRERLSLGQGQFPDSTPYVEHQEVRDISCYKPLLDIIRELHAAEMGLIFNLTGFTSTQRGWHQDAYLDRDSAVPRLAAWFACGRIDADQGPFEYVPGSHRWMALSNERINQFLKPDYQWPNGHRAKQGGVPAWGRISEAFIDPSVFSKIERDNARIMHFTADKGDVLLWYGRTMHRGSPPTRKGATRPGLIAHYAPIFERERGFFAKTHDGGHYLVPPRKADRLYDVPAGAVSSP